MEEPRPFSMGVIHASTTQSVGTSLIMPLKLVIPYLEKAAKFQGHLSDPTHDEKSEESRTAGRAQRRPVQCVRTTSLGTKTSKPNPCPILSK